MLAGLACSYEDALDIVEDALEDVPAELTVTKADDTNDGACTLDDCSLREAILAANGRPGPDKIHVPAGEFSLTLIGDDNLGEVGDLDISDDVEIRGEGWGPTGGMQTIIDGLGEDRIFEVLAGTTVEIRRLQVRNGHYASSGGISNAGDLTLFEVEVFQNQADLNGGGIGSGGTLLLRHVFVVSNSAAQLGGGVYNYFGGTVTIEGGSVIASNHADDYGGGVYTSDGGIAYFASSQVNGNTAASGAGLFVADGSAAQINDTVFAENDASARGGGVYNQGVVDILASRFEGNEAYDGGGLASDWDEGGDGAAVYGTTFQANQAYYGAALHANGALSVRESLVADNIGQSSIVNSDWSAFCALDDMLLENVTVSGNGPWPGTAWHNAILTQCGLHLRFSTIAGHSGHAVSVSATYSAAVPELEGALLSNNDGGNCSASVTTAGSNLSTDSSCGLSDPTDLAGVAAGLEPLGDNGGGTLTHALAADSPALDGAASADCPPIDQRGVTRPRGPACDIGAFESEVAAMPRLATTPTSSATPSPTVGPATGNVDTNANCRSGPGTVYPIVGSVTAGTRWPIVGRDVGGQWWVLDLSALRCWVTAGAVSATGDVSTVPVWPAPPTPTPTRTSAPTATPTYVLIVSVVPKVTSTPVP